MNSSSPLHGRIRIGLAGWFIVKARDSPQAWPGSRATQAGRQTWPRGARRGGFHGGKTAAKFAIGVAQGELRFHLQTAGKVDHGEEQVAYFGNDSFRRRGDEEGLVDGLAQLFGLFVQFCEDAFKIGPVKAALLRPPPIWRLPAAKGARAEYHRARNPASLPA